MNSPGPEGMQSHTEHVTRHRSRRSKMRFKILNDGASSLTDVEVLECLLYAGSPRCDTRKAAKDAIARLGTLGNVLSASPTVLRETLGLNWRAAEMIQLVQLSAVCLTSPEPKTGPLLNAPNAVGVYLDQCQSSTARVLYLDAKCRLLFDKPQQSDIFDVRAILKCALEVRATSVILGAWRERTAATASDLDALCRIRAQGAVLSIDALGIFIITLEDIVAITDF